MCLGYRARFRGWDLGLAAACLAQVEGLNGQLNM